MPSTRLQKGIRPLSLDVRFVDVDELFFHDVSSYHLSPGQHRPPAEPKRFKLLGLRELYVNEKQRNGLMPALTEQEEETIAICGLLHDI